MESPRLQHTVDSVAARTADDLIALWTTVDAGAAKGEDVRLLRELIRNEVYCRLGPEAAQWAADPRWQPTPQERVTVEQALRTTAPMFDDYVMRFRTTMSRQVRAYMGSLETKLAEWQAHGLGRAALGDAMRGRGFPGVLTRGASPETPLSTADVLSQLVALSSLGGALGQAAADNAYVCARWLGYTGRRPVVPAEGMTPEAASAMLVTMTPRLAAHLDRRVVAGGACVPANRPPSAQVVQRSAHYVEVAAVQARRVNTPQDVRTRVSMS